MTITKAKCTCPAEERRATFLELGDSDPIYVCRVCGRWHATRVDRLVRKMPWVRRRNRARDLRTWLPLLFYFAALTVALYFVTVPR